MGNLEFLGKSATVPRFVLLVVDLYSSKVYVYPMRSKKEIPQKMKQFYEEIKIERNIQKAMRRQVDNEFQEVKIKDLNEKINIEMFTSSVRGGKAFAAEQKIRELKSRIAKLNALKLKVPPTKIITTAENMNIVLNEKFEISPNDIEKKSLSSEKFRKLFNFHQIEKIKQVNYRLDRYDRKKYSAKRRKLLEKLNVGEGVLLLAERIIKIQHLQNFISNRFKTLHILTKNKSLLLELNKK